MNKPVGIVAAALLLAGPAVADPAQVVALGDSLTAGYGLPDGEGFVPRLQAWLDAEGVDATVVNAGVSGDTTAGGLARLDWSIDGSTDALIVALGGNDLLRGLDPATSRANLDAIVSRATDDGLPVLVIGLDAPGNYGPGYQKAFDSMFPDVAETYGALWERSFFGALTEDADLNAARERYFQPDGIHPNAAGVELIVTKIGPRVEELVDRVQAE